MLELTTLQGKEEIFEFVQQRDTQFLSKDPHMELSD